MKHADFQRAEHGFRQYTARFADAAGALHPMLQLKFDHSRRVADECRGLASELRWEEAEQRRAEAAGLLHDIGRFPQFAEHRTFADPLSIDHGERGFAVLTEEPLFENGGRFLCQALLDAVRYHNRREVPESVGGSRPLVNMVRDADKLDIFHVVVTAIRTGSLDRYPEILLRVDRHGPPNPELVAEIEQGRTGRYPMIKSVADFCLMQLSWVYDINTAPALRRIAERGVFETLGELLPDTPEMRRVTRGVRAQLDRRLAAGA